MLRASSTLAGLALLVLVAPAQAQQPEAQPPPAEPPPAPPPEPAPPPPPPAEPDPMDALEPAPARDRRVAMVTPDFSEEVPGITRMAHHDHRWFWNNLTAVRVNPLGLTNRARTGYQMQLSHRPEPVFEQSFASVQLDTEITPAFGYVGARFEVQPAALFNFWASYGFVGSFGSFSYTRSFESPHDEYDDDLLKDTRDLDYATTGHRATVSGLFQFGIGGVAVRDNVMAHWTSMDLEPGDRVFWDATLDVLMPDGDWVITNDADLLILTEFNLKFGLRYTLTAALYDDELLDGEENINTPHHRVGPVALYTFFEDKPGALWNKPTLALITQWWVQHRYRTEDKPALPYIVLAFVQEGDFMISAKE